MLELYSTPPKTKDEQGERLTWVLNEKAEKNRNALLMIMGGSVVGFLGGLHLYAIVILAVGLGLAGYSYTKNKQDRGWRRYWEYYEPHLDDMLQTNHDIVHETIVPSEVDPEEAEPETYQDIKRLILASEVSYLNLHNILETMLDFLDWAPEPSTQDIETLEYCIKKLVHDYKPFPWAKKFYYKLYLLKAMLAYAQKDWVASRSFVNRSIKQNGITLPQAAALLVALNKKTTSV